MGEQHPSDPTSSISCYILHRHFKSQVKLYNSKCTLGRNIKKEKMKGRLRGKEGKKCGKGLRGQTHIM